MLSKNKLGMALLVMMLMFGIVLAACSKDKEPDTGTEPEVTDETNEDDPDEEEVVVDDGPKKGGTITGAMYSAPAGLFNPIFYTETYEANIIGFTHEGLTTQNDKLEFIPSLAKAGR